MTRKPVFIAFALAMCLLLTGLAAACSGTSGGGQGASDQGEVAQESTKGLEKLAGITFTVDTTVPYEKGAEYANSTYYAPAKPGSRVTITDIGGKGFDLGATYTIATVGFVAAGGDTYHCFAEAAARSQQILGVLDHEAVINYLKDELGGTVPDRYAQPQGRITVIE